MATLTWFRILCAGAVGFIAWQGEFWTIALSIIAPCLIAAQPNRASGTATAFAYYGATSLPVMTVSKAYWPSQDAPAVLIWLAAAAILCLPWLLCWTSRKSLRPWATTAAIALAAVPPLCIFGWASPLIAAGVLFPNTAWFGIAGVLALPGLLLNDRTRITALLTTAGASLILNAQAKPISVPDGWAGAMTSIHRQRKPDDSVEFVIEEGLQQIAQSSRATFLVFPEGAVRLWTNATDAFWAETISGSGKTLLIGASQPILGSARQTNSVVIVGKHPQPSVHQRIPVPGGMWNPFGSQGGFALNLFGSGTIDVGGERAAILICYEQLLTWPMLRSAIESPTLLIAVSNETWTATTVVPRVQRSCVRAWARLFALPVVSAINL